MDEIDSFLIRQVQRNNSPSINYIIFDQDSIIHRCMFGFANIRGQVIVDENTTYNAFSVTKTFTALAVLKLAEQNMLDLDKPARIYFSDFPYTPDITLRHLLAHSAGIPNPIPLSWIHLSSEHRSFDKNNFFSQIFSQNKKTKSKPNEKFVYSNLGYVLLGQVIEKVSGLSYEEYITETIIKKLNIQSDDMGFEIPDSTHATGYHKRLSFSNLMLGIFIDKSKYMDQAEGAWRPFKSIYVNGPYYGGLVGKAGAFVKYIQELLKPDSPLVLEKYKKMLFKENFLDNNKATGMCLAWFQGRLNGQTYFAHAGGGGGYYCELRIYPDLGIGSVIFFNRTGLSDERFLNKVDTFSIKKINQQSQR